MSKKSPDFTLTSIKMETNYGGYQDDVIQILKTINDNIVTIGEVLIYTNDGVKTSTRIVNDESGEKK